MIDQSDTKNRFLELFRQFETGLNGQKSSALHQWRKEAWEQFASQSFPTTRDEEWKYTNLDGLLKQSFEVAQALTELSASVIDRIAIPTAMRFVFVNGLFSKGLSESSMPGNIKVNTLSSLAGSDRVREILRIKPGENIFSTINNAFMLDGLVIDIPDNVICERPIHVIYVTTDEKNFTTQPVTLLGVGKSAQCAVIEEYVSVGVSTHFTNARTEIRLAENAVAHHTRIQTESRNAYHISATTLHQERSSSFMTTHLNLGGALSRNLTTAHLDGEGIESTLDGLYMPTGTQHTDNRTVIHHAKPNCNSHELYKGIMDGKSTAVFNGKIFVHPDAQKTDAKQSNNNLLLSPDATINTKPQLEIFADDVKCTHGATIGRLEENGMFYLRSRGIRFEEARSIMTLAFAGEIIARIGIPQVRERLSRELHERLHMSFE